MEAAEGGCPGAHLGALAGLLSPLFVMLATVALVMPNTAALALSRHGEAAGTAAAVLWAVQFSVGSLLTPLVGLLGNNGGAIAVVMTGATAVALLGSRRSSFAVAVPVRGTGTNHPHRARAISTEANPGLPVRSWPHPVQCPRRRGLFTRTAAIRPKSTADERSHVEDIDAYAIAGGRAFRGNKGTGVTTSDQTLALALQFGVTTQLEMSAAADTVADAHSSGIAVTAPQPGLGDSRRRGSVVTCATVLVDSGPRGRKYDAQGEDLMIFHQTRYTIRPDAPKDQVDHALEMLHRMG